MKKALTGGFFGCLGVLGAIVAVSVVLIVILAIVSGDDEEPSSSAQGNDATATAPSGSSDQTSPTIAPASTSGVPPTETPVPPTPTPAVFTFGSGTKIVRAEVAPGTYRTRPGSSSCFWTRLSGFGGTFEEIIANDFGSGPAIVTIAAGDVGFDSSGCSDWSEDLSAITADPNGPFGEGTFIVGTDVAAGTWRADGDASGCFWTRLSGFSGGFDQIIANNFGANVVTIAATDAGFDSSDCGTWTKIS